MKKEHLPSWILALLLVSPFLIILSRIELNFHFDSAELMWAFSNSLAQALGSAAMSLIFGLMVMLATLGSDQKKGLMQLLSVLVVMPTVLPVLFIVLALFYVLKPFPMGWMGIVITHTVIHAGAIGLSLSQAVRDRFTQLGEVAYVMGASRLLFWKKGVLPGIKGDLRRNFILVFASAFTSFSVPLMVGGQRGTNLEVLIYEKIRITQDWGSAVALSLIQTAFLFLIFIMNKELGRASTGPGKAPLWGNVYFSFPFMQKIIFLLYGVFLSSFFWGIGESFYTVQLADLLKINFSQLLVGSLVIGILSIFMLTLIFSFALLYMDNRSLRKFIIAFVAPSTAMTSFAFLLVFGSEGFHPYWTIPLVLVLLFLPVFYKLFWETKFQELEGQFEVARVLGASRLLILKRVMWPQVQITLQKSMLLMFAWATSDFAVSRILSSTEMSLAMAVDNLLGSYRLSLAFVACGYLLVFMGVGLLLIKGAFYVSRHKS